MKTLAAIVILAAPLWAGHAQTPDVPTNRIAAPKILFMTSQSNLVSISNAVKVAAGLDVGMTWADTDNHMQQHGMMQTNVFWMSLDRGRTMSRAYPLAGVGTSLMLEFECSQPPKSGLFGWKNPLLKRAYIQSQGDNIMSITLTNSR